MLLYVAWLPQLRKKHKVYNLLLLNKFTTYLAEKTLHVAWLGGNLLLLEGYDWDSTLQLSAQHDHE